MRNIRIIARLDVKTKNIVKGIRLEGLRKMGIPSDFSRSYYNEGIDELIYIDIVASLYERNSLIPIVEEASYDTFIPLTAGGGVRSVENARELLHAGADKVSINTAAIKNPELISSVSDSFGAQCVVASIEAQRIGDLKWEAYYDNGREKTGLDVIEWAKELEDRGAGEILLTSVDREGTGKGMDIDLVSQVCDAVNIPVISSGGVGEISHILEIIKNTRVNAVALARVLHYKKFSVGEIKEALSKLQGIEIR